MLTRKENDNITKAKNEKLLKLRTQPNDECYTSLADINNELLHYSKHFKGKNIICPCDWDILDDGIISIKIEFDENGQATIYKNCVKKEYNLLTICEEDTSDIITDKNAINNFLRNRIKSNFVQFFLVNGGRMGIKSVTASGFLPDTSEGVNCFDIDYSKYDIVVTNPPFSLYKQFLNKVMTSGIDCILIAPFVNRTSPLEGEWIQDNKLFLGYNRDKSLNFINPTKENGYKTKNVAVDWITTFRDAQDELDAQTYKTGLKYDTLKDEYHVLELVTMKDGTHPIRIEKMKFFPDDYDGWMFVPLSAMDKYVNYKDYDIYFTSLLNYWNKLHPEKSPFEGTFDKKQLKDNGKILFAGLIIKKKNK